MSVRFRSKYSRVVLFGTMMFALFFSYACGPVPDTNGKKDAVRDKCLNDNDCKTGQYCKPSDGDTAQGQSANTRGAIGYMGFCEDKPAQTKPGQTKPKPADNSCASNDDCKQGEYCYIERSSSVLEKEGALCKQPSTSVLEEEGSLCKKPSTRGVCKAKPTPQPKRCKSDNDCGEAETCSVDPAGKWPGKICIERTKPAERPCTIDDDCQRGEYCDNPLEHQKQVPPAPGRDGGSTDPDDNDPPKAGDAGPSQPTQPPHQGLCRQKTQTPPTPPKARECMSHDDCAENEVCRSITTESPARGTCQLKK